MTAFVDSSVWFAAAVRRDRSNARARAIREATDDLVTSEHVLIETWLLLNSRCGGDAAEQFWDGMRRGAARLEMITAADLEAAWNVGAAFADRQFSPVDRTSLPSCRGLE